MRSKTEKASKIEYTKPEVFNFGEVTPVQGVTCATGDNAILCGGGGSLAGTTCSTGTGAASFCSQGSLIGYPT